MLFVCRKCGKEFEEKPLEHGDFVGNVIEGFKHIKCDGEVERATRDYENLRKWASNKG